MLRRCTKPLLKLRKSSTLRQAAGCLRAQDFSAVVIDQSAVDLEPDESDSLLQRLGTAVPVYVNFAIHGMQRVVRELRVALQRREREGQIARHIDRKAAIANMIQVQ